MWKKECRKDFCFRVFDFVEAKNGDNLQEWKTAIREVINTTIDNLEKEIKPFGKAARGLPAEEISPLIIFPQFSFLAILISEEFEACLDALIEDNWLKFEHFFYSPDYLDWEEARECIVEGLFKLLDHQKLIIKRGAVPSVYEVLSGENHWNNPDYLTLDFERYNRDRLILSIDRYAPIETIIKQVSEILKKEREQQHLRFFENWEKKLSYLKLPTDLAGELAQKDFLSYNYASDSKGRKKNNLETVLTSLRVYAFIRSGRQRKDIRTEKWWSSGSETQEIKNLQRDISRYKEKAQKIIKATLSEIPISAVKFPK